MTTTILRKDIRQLRVLIGLLLGLLAVLVAVRLEWTGGVAPDPGVNAWTPPMLEGILALFTLILAGKMVSYLIWEDSPARRERFLATRPVSGRSLLLAKLSFLVAFVIVPFAMAAALYLALSGMPARVILLGTVQSIVRSIALLGLGVPLVLLWDTRGRFTAGIASIGAGLIGFLITLGLLDEFHRALAPFRIDAINDPLVQVIAIAVAALCLSTLAAIHLRRPLRMTPRLAVLFLTGIVAPLLGGLLTTHRQASPTGEVASCTAVRNSTTWQQNDGTRTLAVNLTPSVTAPAGRDLNWSYSSLTIGANDIPLRPQNNPRLFPTHYLNDGALTGALESALRERLGPGWSIASPRHGRRTSGDNAWAYAPDSTVPANPATLDAVFQGNAFSWHAVAEIPLVPGTRARDGADTWTFHGSALNHNDGLSLSITHRGPELWLEPGGRQPGFENDVHRFVLLDPERRLAMLIDDRYPVRQRLATSTACPRRGLLVQLDGFEEARDFTDARPESLRLLILRPRYEGIQFCRWTSPEPLELRTNLPAEASGLAKDQRNLKPEDITRWLEQNPGPAADAPAAEVARHLVSLLEQTHHSSQLGTDHPAVAALAVYVPEHLDLFLRALAALHMDQHASHALLHDALGAGLERHQIPEIVRQLASRPGLVSLVIRRDWTADIAPDLARLIRGGNTSHALLQAAASLPDTAGIRPEEWLAIFRLDPSSGIYGILRTIPGLGAELDTIVDARLAGHIPLLMDTSVDPLLQLALTRGHPEGPAWLQQALRYAISLSEHNGTWFTHTIRKHIDLSSFPDHHGDPDLIVPWLLAGDPASFTFDSSTRLYTPPSTPNQSSKIKNQ